MRLKTLLAAERARQRGRLLAAGAAAAVVTAASVTLLGLSGWFITASAMAGAAGAAAAHGFNYMLPSAGIRLLAILRTGARYGERLVRHEVALHALARIRPALFAALADAPPAASLALSTGEASARLVGDVDAVEDAIIRRPARWGAIASVASGAALLLAAGPWPALAAAAVAAGFLLFADRLARRAEAPGRAVQRATGALKEEVARLAAAAPELRAYGLEGWATALPEARAMELLEAQRALAAGAGRLEFAQALAIGLAATLALALSAEGPLPLAALAALGAAMTVDGTAAFARGLSRRGGLEEAEARLDAVLDIDPPPRRTGSMPSSPELHLSSPAARLRPGTVAAITGPSGAGKTALFETLLALRPVGDGVVGIGGTDLAALPPSAARAVFSHAPQDAALLAGTVRENLLIAAPEATEAMLWQVLRDAALDDRIRLLGDGLDTWIGENGTLLSGGERRRLALARALLRPSPWLLLDEPTEGLDEVTEGKVLSGLSHHLLRMGRGALIITHRPGPLDICEIVLELDSREAEPWPVAA